MNFKHNKYVRFDQTSLVNPYSSERIKDSEDSFFQKWNRIFIFLCVLAASLDPLFFYIPVIDGVNKCIYLDNNLKVVVCVLRTFTDAFYLLRIIFQFRTAPSSRIFGRGELIQDCGAIAKKYLSSYFIVDVLSILPLPQLVVLAVIPNVEGPVSRITKDMLTYVIFVQYVPRLIRIYPVFKDVTATSGIFTETAWAGAAFNLSLFMLASHVVGAFWYSFSIEREGNCWQIVSDRNNRTYDNLYCGPHRFNDISHLMNSCTHLERNDIINSTTFDFGIFLDVLRSGVAERRDFLQKFLYCFWWGLKNLSSLGQGLNTSTYSGEILFAVFIGILGLVLFSLFIGNMQKYLQSIRSISLRLEEMREEEMREIEMREQWMSRQFLPEELRGRLRRYNQFRWKKTRGVEEESVLRNLPKDLRLDIKRHLCCDLLRRVPMFNTMEEELLDAMCDRLKPVHYIEHSFIIREGDQIEEMLFVREGKISTYHFEIGSYNETLLKAGDFCGEELLTWALDSNSSKRLPSSTITVKAITDVEAFALMADDITFIASQFRMLHSNKIKHTFRLCSRPWREWGACFIQSAWRRYCKRKLEKMLHAAEDRLQDVLLTNISTNSVSLGAALYASKFTANALRALRNNQARSSSPEFPSNLPLLLLEKPFEPDFTAQNL